MGWPRLRWERAVHVSGLKHAPGAHVAARIDGDALAVRHGLSALHLGWVEAVPLSTVTTVVIDEPERLAAQHPQLHELLARLGNARERCLVISRGVDAAPVVLGGRGEVLARLYLATVSARLQSPE